MRRRAAAHSAGDKDDPGPTQVEEPPQAEGDEAERDDLAAREDATDEADGGERELPVSSDARDEGARDEVKAVGDGATAPPATLETNLQAIGSPMSQITFVAIVAVAATAGLFLPMQSLGNRMFDPVAQSKDYYGDAVMRTPPVFFRKIKDWPYEPKYFEHRGLRIAYVEVNGEDERAAGTAYPEAPECEGQRVFLLHGNPTWSYLWRKVLPSLEAKGCHVVAPDLIGFGRSDKPVDGGWHTHDNHARMLEHLLIELEWHYEVTLVAHDWGSVIGLNLVAVHPEVFSRVMVTNGYFYPAAAKEDNETAVGHALYRAYVAAHRFFSSYSSWFPIVGPILYETNGGLKGSAVDAYKAPFPHHKYKAGPRAMAGLMPVFQDDEQSIAHGFYRQVMAAFEKPVRTFYSSGDMYTRGHAERVHTNVPGAKGQRHTTIAGKHYSPEYAGEQLADALLDFLRDSKKVDPICVSGQCAASSAV